MGYISHDESTPTHVAELGGLPVFSAAPDVIDGSANAPTEQVHGKVGGEEVRPSPPRRISSRGIGLIMVSPTIHAPGEVPTSFRQHLS